MEINSFYPVICSDKIQESLDFYVKNLGFTITFEADWYVSLRKKDKKQYELAILDHTHPTIPKGFNKPVQGLLLNFEVDKVDVEYERLIKNSNLPLFLDIKDEHFGQRHFIIADPNGVLIDIIQVIPLSEEFAKQYNDTS